MNMGRHADPLLPIQNSQAAEARGDLGERRREILIDISKSWIAFALSTLLTFVPEVQRHLGYSSHLASVTVLLFHPGKTVGAMFQATIAGVLGALFATVVCVIAQLLAMHFNQNNQPAGTISTFLGLLFLSSFILAYMRARDSRQAVYTGSIVAMLILYVMLTSGSLIETREHVDLLRIRQVIVPILCGLAVSLLSNILIFPISARDRVR